MIGNIFLKMYDFPNSDFAIAMNVLTLGEHFLGQIFKWLLLADPPFQLAFHVNSRLQWYLL